MYIYIYTYIMCTYKAGPPDALRPPPLPAGPRPFG